MPKVNVIYDDLNNSAQSLANVSASLDKTFSEISGITSTILDKGHAHDDCFSEALEELNKIAKSLMNEQTQINHLRSSCKTTAAAFQSSEEGAMTNALALGAAALGMSSLDGKMEINSFKTRSEYKKSGITIDQNTGARVSATWGNVFDVDKNGNVVMSQEYKDTAARIASGAESAVVSPDSTETGNEDYTGAATGTASSGGGGGGGSTTSAATGATTASVASSSSGGGSTTQKRTTSSKATTSGNSSSNSANSTTSGTTSSGTTTSRTSTSGTTTSGTSNKTGETKTGNSSTTSSTTDNKTSVATTTTATPTRTKTTSNGKVQTESSSGHALGEATTSAAKAARANNPSGIVPSPDKGTSATISGEDIIDKGGKSISRIPSVSALKPHQASKTSSSGSAVIPLASGLSAAAAAGIGAKAYMDKKKNSDDDSDNNEWAIDYGNQKEEELAD